MSVLAMSPPDPCPIEQWACIFPSLFAADTPVLVFLVSLHVTYQIQLRMGFGFPNPIATCSSGVFVFCLGNLGPSSTSLTLPFF